MADRLYLSLWLNEVSDEPPVRKLMRLLELFPLSRLTPRVSLTVRAVSTREAPLFEDSFAGDDLAPLAEAASAWTSPDHAFEIDAAWDLLIEDRGDWSLRPSRVTIFAFGPGFEREDNDDLRIEFGTESPFIPTPESPESFRFVQENIRSLLRLVKEIEDSLPLSRRKLWSESGENFAQRLAGLLQP
jgi:hypothetical protein